MKTGLWILEIFLLHWICLFNYVYSFFQDYFSIINIHLWMYSFVYFKLLILYAKSWLIWKDPDAGKDWEQEEKGTAENEMVGWHHRLHGHEFGWTLGVADGQGGLACCNSWGRKELDTDERLNWTELNWELVNNAVIVSGGQQRASATHTHVFILPQTPLPSRLPHNIKQNLFNECVQFSQIIRIFFVKICSFKSEHCLGYRQWIIST